tara:strand:+ start:111 stop:368 length:258 start_codon:yes stop_codon:yes gene_type:complete
MLRVRSQSGKTIVPEEPLKYVEILDKSGNVAMVLYREDIGETQAVTLITPEMDEAKTYAKLYGLKWSKSIEGDWPTAEPMEVNIN